MANNEAYDEAEEDRDDFEDVRHDLNLDEATMEDALKTYQDIKVNFKLEGEKMDWIACAIYSSCRRRVTQTMGRSKIEGNMVSLTRILRSCKISLARFFNKMKNWMAMAKLSPEMRSKLDQLERNFNVTSVIFKKYKPMFEDIFKCVENRTCRFATKKPKGLRKQPLTSLDIFTFCWTLFVYIKSRYSQINDDLINSYHLLVVCLDYCYSSVLSFDNYADIINSNFYDDLAKDLTTDPRSHNNDNRVSIIDKLCVKWKGIAIEVKQIKKHWFEPFLKALTEKDDTPIRKRSNGIIDCDVVDFNYKYFKREYETYVLGIGDFDECVFLNETASEELGTEEFNGEGTGSGGSSSSSTIDSVLQLRMTPNSAALKNAGAGRINHDQPNNLMPMTPLSSRDYLACRTPVNRAVELTPITAATDCISRLQSILVDRKSEPSEALRELLAKCKSNPVEAIARMIKEMGDVFLAAYNANNENNDPAAVGAAASAAVGVIRRNDELQYVVSNNFPKRRLELAIAFFYRVLENILNDELKKMRKFPGFDCTTSLVRVLEQTIFLRSLFACSLEIVLHSYSPTSRLFPWILNIFNNNNGGDADLKLHSFHFYKVIELIARSEPVLSRELVKHLNAVEEAILERYAWTADSPVWALLRGGGVVPSVEETQSFSSPAPKLLAAAAAAASSGSGVIIQPPNGAANVARRMLAFDDESGAADAVAPPPPPPLSVPGPSAPPTDAHQLQHPLSNGGGPAVIKSEGEEGGSSVGGDGSSTLKIGNHNGIPPPPPPSATAAAAAALKQITSGQQLKLFFRKVYNVALLRLRDLTKRLAVREELVQMMWTILVEALRAHTELMCEHHLDQLIMCSVYTICKMNTNIKFAEIVKEYRLQPQAKNYVYRNVLLAIREYTTGEQATATAEVAENTGDLIKFYNNFFIPRMDEAFIISFKIGDPRQNANLTLSPMPAHRNPLISPLHQSPIRRVTDNVFVSPLPATAHHHSGSSGCPISPVSRSSQSIRIQYTSATVTNDLKALNSMMANHRGGGGGGIGRNWNNAAPAGSSGTKRVGKRILQDVLEGDGGSCGSSSSSASHGGVGGKMPCLSRKINDILADRNQFQQFSAAAAAVAAASLSAAASANGSGAEDNNNSNDLLQFNLAGVGAGAVPEASIRTGGSVLYLPNGVLTGIDMGGSPPTAVAAAAPVMSSVAVE